MENVAVGDQAASRYGSSVHKQVYIYGGLDRGPTVLTRSYGMARGMGGWLLTPFPARAGAARVAAMRERVVAGLTTTFASHFTREITLDGALHPDTISAYARQSTGNKFRITPAVR